MADRSVRVILRAEIGQYVAGIEKAKQSTKDFATGVTDAAKRNDHGMQTLGKVALVTGGVIAAGFAKAVMVAADFEKQMSGVKAVSGASAEEMDRLSEAAIKAGASTQLAGVTASDAARAEAELVKAGVSVADVLGGGLMGSLTLASAGQLDFAKSAEIAAQAMNIFDLAGSDVTHIADVLAAAANKSAADVGQLGDALRQGGLVAAQTGLSLEESVGALAAFADNALLGSDAGTSLKTMLQRLTPQSDEAAGLMRELGFSAYDLHGNFIGLEGLAGELQEALGDMTVQQRNSAMATLFGSDAVRAANILYEEGAAGMQDYVDAVDDQGAAARMAAEQNNNLAGDVEALGGALESVFIENGSKATGMLRSMTQGVTDLVTGFSELPGPLQTVVGGMGALTGAASLAFGGFVMLAPKFSEASRSLTAMDSSLAKFAGNNLGKLTAGLAGVGAVIAAGTLIYEKATASSRRYAAEVDALADALKPVTDGQSDLNTEMENFLELQSADLSTNAIAGLNAVKISFDDIERSIRSGGDAIDPLRAKADELGIDFGRLGGLSKDLAGTDEFAELAAAMGISSRELRDLLNEVEDWDNTAQDAARSTIEAAEANGTFSAGAVDAAIEANTAADGTVNWAGALDDLAPGLQGTGTDAEVAAGGVGELTGGLQDSAEAADEARTKFQELLDAYRASVDPLFAALDALQSNREAMGAEAEARAEGAERVAEAQEALAEAEKALRDARSVPDNAAAIEAAEKRLADARERLTEAQDDAVISAEELAEMNRDVAASALDVDVAMKDLAMSIADGSVDVEDAKAMLAEWVTQGLLTEEQAANMAEQFDTAAAKADELAGEYVAEVRAEGADEAIDKLRGVNAWLDAVNRSVAARIEVQLDNPYARVSGPQLGLASGGLVPQYLATGGISAGFGPRGSDTVPAWLTPGEFVMRKAAVDRFGVGFLDSLNRGHLSPVASQVSQRVDNSRHITIAPTQTITAPTPQRAASDVMYELRLLATGMG